MTVSSPWRRSWNEPYNCIIRELDEEARACSSVFQILAEVGQSITRWRIFVDHLIKTMSCLVRGFSFFNLVLSLPQLQLDH